MRTILAAVAVALSVSCVRFELFACGDEEECVLEGVSGTCEPSGYCSFPDPECPSMRRYSDHAPAGLARECVEEPGTSTDAGTGSESGSASGGIAECRDDDGDGFGVGAACDLLDCDDDNPLATDDCVYLGPGGDDAAPGTRDAPWATFAHAVSMLEPGESLVVLDGTYTTDDAGTFHASCDSTAKSGTAQAPIFVRAENDRRAVIDADGFGSGFTVADCEYWRVRGFVVLSRERSAEDGGEQRDTVSVARSHFIELRRFFISGVNRYFNVKGLGIGSSEDVLLEDTEVHDFFRAGFIVFTSNRVTCRRCYGHSHGARDLSACPDRPACTDPTDPEMIGTADCPFCSAGSSERGDDTFFVQHSNDFLCENCVSEGSQRGFTVRGGTGLDDMRAGYGIRVLQSLSVGDAYGIEVRNEVDKPPAVGVQIEDFVAIAPTTAGIRADNPDGLVLRNATILGSDGDGVTAESDDPTVCTAGACSIDLESLLVLDAGGEGIDLTALDAWSITSCNVFGSATQDYAYPDLAGDPFDDDAGSARNNRSEEAMGVGLADDACRVYVPADSNVAGIGGNVTDLLVDGIRSGEPLWADDGSFPCGPDPAAPAQIAGEQCSDLASRAAVGTAGCPVPAPRG
jgi:hypothetical protein